MWLLIFFVETWFRLSIMGIKNFYTLFLKNSFKVYRQMDGKIQSSHTPHFPTPPLLLTSCTGVTFVKTNAPTWTHYFLKIFIYLAALDLCCHTQAFSVVPSGAVL